MGDVRAGVLTPAVRGPAAAPTAAPAPPGLPWLAVGVFLVSAATLYLEILQTRLFSVLLWHHVTYLVVTFTLLGFAAGGTCLALFPRLAERPGRVLAVSSLGFALTTVGAFELLGRSRLDTLRLLQERTQFLVVFAYYLYLVVPFFLAGLSVVAALKVAGPWAGAAYAANLVGSAAGCVLFALTLTPLGGEACVLLGAALAALAAVAFARLEPGRRARRGLGAAGLGGAAGLLALLPVAPALLPLEAAPSKLMVNRIRQVEAAGGEAHVLATRWDPLCRIDVVDLGEPHQLAVYQDADAPTTIFAADRPRSMLSLYDLPYVVGAPHPAVLVIGAGGGVDLRVARWNEAAAVTGVEVNRSTADLLRGPFAAYSGNVYEAGGVRVEVTEGRSYVRRSRDLYDVIQLTGTDTYAALSSGAYVLTESYLYTVEAFADYFDRLSEDGFVSVLRFRFFPPRESLRLMAIGVEALRRRGAEHPERHVLAVDQVSEHRLPDDPSRTVTIAYTAMLFKKTPLTEAEIERGRAFASRHPLGSAVALAYAPGVAADPVFTRYFEAVAQGREDAFLADYDYRVEPVHDDAPFFFHFHRWGSLFDWQERARHSGSAYLSAIGENPAGLMLLGTAFLESSALVVLLVILPLFVSRRLRMPARGRLPVLLYFLGLGIGYLFLEIACMQRLVLYLGHPTRSLTVVLATFLLFSGVGSALARRFLSARIVSGALPVVLVLVALYAVFLPDVLEATLHWSGPARIACAVALLAVPALFMGMPFPSGLLRLQGPCAPFLPWAFAINGGASVVASVAAVFVAMSGGFTVVFWLALAAYGLALLAAPRLPAASGQPV